MILKNTLEDILIQKDQKITEKVINSKFQKLIENDFSIIPSEVMEPTIWECKWFNNPQISGYSQGDACWLNTENIDDFILYNHNKIYDYAKNNDYLTNIIKKFQINDTEMQDLYRNVLSGYYDINTGVKIQPIFQLGDIREKTRIRISKIDNNKYNIYDNKYWMDFFVDHIDIELGSSFNYAISDHLKNYHLNGKTIDLTPYCDTTLSNVTKIQKLTNHSCDVHKDSRSGLDYISSFKGTYSEITSIAAEVSSIQMEQFTYVWYELTGEPYYVLNNGISKDDISKKLGSIKNYTQLEKMIPTESNMGFGNVAFQLEQLSSAPIFGSNFPVYFKYDDELYEKVQDNLSRYQIQDFCVGEMVTQNPRSDISSYYTNCTPLSVEDLNSIPINLRGRYIRKYERRTKINNIEDTNNFFIYDKWVEYYKSGYVVQGGYINIGQITEPCIKTIKLLQPYDYIITQKSVYGNVVKLTEDKNYENYNTLRNFDRYTVSFTPITDSFFENNNIEIVGMENDRFSIFVDINTPKQIFYQVQGIIGQD